MKKTNIHTTREAWLLAGWNDIRPHFQSLGYEPPDNIRLALSFTSGGKRGIEGECWHPQYSGDNTYEIIIKADHDDPVEILGILIHQMIHTLLSPEAKHGREFRDIALRVGMEGRMSHAMPGALLRDRLAAIAEQLGPLPHAKLDLASGAIGAKKSGVRMLKAECPAACGYTIRILPKWAKIGLPFCPVAPAHGTLVCDFPDEDDKLSSELPQIYHADADSDAPHDLMD
jgi:hypothetical protein